MLMEMNRYLSFTLFTGLSLLTTIPIEAYTLNPNKTATSILQTNVIEVRSITSVQPIVIYCPVGTVPQLPYQVWVTYIIRKSKCSGISKRKVHFTKRNV